MDEVDWKVLWGAGLAPDQAMIPSAHVFHTRRRKRLRARKARTWIQEMSLLAHTDGIWANILTPPHRTEQPDNLSERTNDFFPTHSGMHTTDEAEFLWMQAMINGETH